MSTIERVRARARVRRGVACSVGQRTGSMPTSTIEPSKLTTMTVMPYESASADSVSDQKTANERHVTRMPNWGGVCGSLRIVRMPDSDGGVCSDRSMVRSFLIWHLAAPGIIETVN